MIDYGLVVSIIAAFGIPALLVHRWPLSSYPTPVSFLDVAVGPAFAALVVGRLTTLALDDPNSIGSISDMIIIRSGVEFWAGAAAAVALVAWDARRSETEPLVRLVDLAPLAMVAYAAYEAACIFRDGCLGPESPIGLRPPGLTTPMVPVGWFMALAVAAAAIAVHRLATQGLDRLIVALSAVASVASVRAVGSIWLPHVGDGLTRQHETSIAITLLVAAGLVTRGISRQRSNTSGPHHV